MASESNPVPPDGTWLDAKQAGGTWLDAKQAGGFLEWIQEIEADTLLAGPERPTMMTPDELYIWLGIGFEAGWSRRRPGIGGRLPARHLLRVGWVREAIRALFAR